MGTRQGAPPLQPPVSLSAARRAQRVKHLNTQLTLNRLKTPVVTLEKGVKYIQS